jgi:beta-mannosidase
MRTQQHLTGEWALSLAGGKPEIALPSRIAGHVPGSVHTDLHSAGIIEDPFLDDNERLQAWIGYCDWTYEREFSWSGRGDTVETHLVFDGIDTIAEICLNGQVIGRTANQHRSYRFDVSDKLVEGSNIVSVTLSSPIRYADQKSLEFGYRPHVNHHPYNAIRKMAASFGWDWGIDTSSIGIWRDVYIESFEGRICNVRPIVSLADGEGLVDVVIELDGTRLAPLTVSLANELVTIAQPKKGENTVSLRVANPDLWWPSGDGKASLYKLQITLGESDSALDEWSSHIGFRQAEVRFPRDADGVGFEIWINDRPIFIRGANWIPNDAFVHRITRESLRERLEQAQAANINLIRVWGGGLYETEDFYELCDELGLMVWQDFPFACASYSEEDLFDEVEAEARENITRIMKHPSLTLWNGNNENLWGYQEWNWEQRLEGKSWGAGFYHELLPRLVSELDPGRPYTPGSPYSPDPDRLHNDQSYGSVHIWDLWNQKDYPHYRDYKPRFVAEFGWQGPANWSTITQAISDDPLTPESPGMLVHQKAMSGNDKLTDGLVAHLSLPNTMSEWHWAMQLNQANAIRFGLEHMRNEYPRCMGAIVWQLNDCWPVTSWAAIDGAGREKPLYFAIEQSYSPLLVTIESTGEASRVHVINNSRIHATDTLVILRQDYDGSVLARHEVELDVEQNSRMSIDVPKDVGVASGATHELLAASFGQHRAVHFFAEYKDSLLAKAVVTTALEAAPQGWLLTVTASNLVRDLTLMVDKVDPTARVSSGLVTLLPGETHVFDIHTSQDLSLDELTSAEVLRCANQLVLRP